MHAKSNENKYTYKQAASAKNIEAFKLMTNLFLIDSIYETTS